MTDTTYLDIAQTTGNRPSSGVQRNLGSGDVVEYDAVRTLNEAPGGLVGRENQEGGLAVPPAHPASPARDEPVSEGRLGNTGRRVGEHTEATVPHTPRANGDGLGVERHPGTEIGAEAPIRHDPYEERAPPTSGKKKSRAALRIASLNMKGGGSRKSQEKWEWINTILRTKSINALALQETHMTRSAIAALESRFSRLKVFSSAHPTHPSSRGGVAVIINKHNTRWEAATSEEIIPGRALKIKLGLNDESHLNILAVYAPSGDDVANAEFWTSLETHFTQTGETVDIVLGDMNMVESPHDREPRRAERQMVVDAFQSFTTELDVRDGWRVINPDDSRYTFRTKRRNGEPNSRARLDRIYVRDALLSRCDEWNICESGIGTDHYMVSVLLSPVGIPFVGKGRSTVPNFVLDYDEMRTAISDKAKAAERKMRDLQNGTHRTAEVNLQTIWRSLKREVMEMSKGFARARASNLDREIEKWEARKEDTLANKDSMEEDDVQALLDEIEDNIEVLTAARLARTKTSIAANVHLRMDGGTAFDYNLRKEKKPRDTVAALQVPLTEPPIYERNSKGMVKIMTKHHDQLQMQYEYDPATDAAREARQAALEALDAKLSLEESDSLDSPLTRDDVEQALLNVPNGKAAGMDGIPVEIWKFLLNEHSSKRANEGVPNGDAEDAADIVGMLTAVFNDIRDHGVAAGTDFALGWLCPLYKKKEKTKAENYRPITVLNTDYKVMTRALSNRIATVAHKLVHPDQAGFMKGRSIFDQVELIRMVLETCDDEDIRGAIMCLDQEKAYDKVSHDFLWATLNKFGFPESFINTIRALYAGAETSVILNGIIGERFAIVRGVRQGDPMSCLLFNLVIESLASMLRKSRLRGLKYEGLTERVLACLFADDTTVFLNKDDDIAHLFEVLKLWCTAAGAKFNIDKTVVIPLGDETYRDRVRTTRSLTRPEGRIPDNVHIAQEGEAVRILGAYFGHNVSEEAIWAPVVEKTRATLKRWAKTKPTIRGRKIGHNALLGGYTQYLTRAQGMPAAVCRELKKITDDFIYAKDGEPASNAIGIETLYGAEDEGGVGLLDISARNEAIEVVRARVYSGDPQMRPMWCKLADRAFARAAVSKYKTIGEEFLIHPFYQVWRVRTNARGLPESLKRMIKIAYKRGVTPVASHITQELRCSMPYWHHIGTKEKKVSIYGDRWGKCQRDCHEIVTVGDMLAHARKYSPASMCGDHVDCDCPPCEQDKADGCSDPPKCRRNAWRKLSNLTQEWDPRHPLQGAHGEEERGMDEDEGELGGTLTVEQITPPQDHPSQVVRAFVAQGYPSALELEIQKVRRTTEEETTIYTDGSCHNNGLATARSGSGLWYGTDHPRNRAVRVPAELPQTNNTGELVAVLVAIQTHAEDRVATVVSDSQYTIDIVSRRLRIWFDQGFVGAKNKEIVRALTGELIRSELEVKLKKVKGHSGDLGNDGADALANEGALLEDSNDGLLSAGDAIRRAGAALGALTQALAYKSIRTIKQAPVRRRTRILVDSTLAAVEAETGALHSHEALWRSLRQRRLATLSQKFSAWAWKSLHMGYKIGSYWTHILPERVACSQCRGEPAEDMAHILTSCKVTHQRLIWALAEEMWDNTGLPWPAITLGTILGIGLIEIKRSNGKPDQGRTRLLRILISESAYLIWVLRCEWRIGRGADPTKLHTASEVAARWKHTIARRLRLDWTLTNRRAFGKKALHHAMVKRTWSGLPVSTIVASPSGALTAGVLVGSDRQRRPPGRNR